VPAPRPVSPPPTDREGPNEHGESGPFLVQGMGLQPVEADWPPLTAEELAALAVGCPALAALAELTVARQSRRPFSAAALVVGRPAAGGRGRLLVVKRHHSSVRTPMGLAEEHRFALHLLAHGVPVGNPLGIVELAPDAVRAEPPVRRRRCGGWTYEVLDAVEGLDLYREALSWTPYLAAGHARSAGRALARFHAASESYDAPARLPSPLMPSSAISSSRDLLEAMERHVSSRPGLASYLTTRRWRDDARSHLLPWHRRLRATGDDPARSWSHGDWHPSNLLWSGAGDSAEVVGVMDLGLCNRTSAAHDLATAIERSAVAWLEPPARRAARVDLVTELLAGYASERRLAPGDLEAIAAILPLVHLEYALSEVEYFHDVVGSPANADLAYDDYLLGHADWFRSAPGEALLGHICALAARRRRQT
jgi:Ser/Thr protein kinase RdoA (MazF antagonist)